MRNSKAFTLIEIIVAVALVAILSAAIAPSVLNNIAQGRIARAQSDTQALAGAIMRFKADVAVFPRLKEGTKKDIGTNNFDFLVTGTNEYDTLGFPEVGTTNWPTAITPGLVNPRSTEVMTYHLIYGTSMSGDSLYPAPDPAKINDPNEIGFRGSLVSSDPLDPWGRKYMSNVAGLGLAGVPVWVISAGPNGLWETNVPDTATYGTAPEVGGDDVGFRVQ